MYRGNGGIRRGIYQLQGDDNGHVGRPREVSLPAYRGDAVNDLEFTQEARRPNPARLVKVYQTSASTLNLVRAFTQGGFADLSLFNGARL